MCLKISEISREEWTSRSMGPKDPKCVNSNMVSSIHVIKLSKVKSKERILKLSREKREGTDNETPISEFLKKNLVRTGMIHSEYQKKNLSAKNSIPS